MVHHGVLALEVKRVLIEVLPASHYLQPTAQIWSLRLIVHTVYNICNLYTRCSLFAARLLCGAVRSSRCHGSPRGVIRGKEWDLAN